MQAKQVCQLLAGATAIYFVMAACSAAEHTRTADSADASDGMGTLPPSGPGITNPVPTASAATPLPSSFVEQCDKTFMSGGTTYRYATHDFPGATAAELAFVRVLVNFGTLTGGPPGYPLYPNLPFIKEGGVSYSCGADGTSTTVMSVTFVKP